MGSFSTNLKSVANRLLNTYGQTISFVRYTTTEYNTTTGSVDPVSSTSFSAICHPSSYRADEINGQTIQVNDVKTIVYSSNQPQVGDEATIDDITYRVLNVEELRAQGEAIVYRLQLRI